MLFSIHVCWDTPGENTGENTGDPTSSTSLKVNNDYLSQQWIKNSFLINQKSRLVRVQQPLNWITGRVDDRCTDGRSDDTGWDTAWVWVLGSVMRLIGEWVRRWCGVVRDKVQSRLALKIMTQILETRTWSSMSNESYNITQNTIEEIIWRKGTKTYQIPERKTQVENSNLRGAELRPCVHVTGVNGSALRVVHCVSR